MNYISKEFQIQYLPYYKLYVLSGHQEELLVVIDDEDRVQVVQRYPSDMPTVEATKLLALPFRKVVVVLPQHNVTFIPGEIYREEEHAVYTKYLLNRNELSVETACLDDYGICTLYQYDALLMRRWNTLYPDAEFMPVFVPLFKQMEAGKASSVSRLLIHTDGHQTHFLLTVDGAFKFYNVFRVETWEDIAYYTLKIAQNLGVTKVDEIVLSSGIYKEKLQAFADRVSVWQYNGHDLDVELSGIANLNLVLNCRECVL